MTLPITSCRQAAAGLRPLLVDQHGAQRVRGGRHLSAFSEETSGFMSGMNMLQSITGRIPCLVSTLHEAVYRGSTYACLSLLAVVVGSVLNFNDNVTNRLGT